LNIHSYLDHVVNMIENILEYIKKQ